MTLLEKFEVHAQRVAFAIVLLTPDDIGYPLNRPQQSKRPRARQNVILELGYFAGALKRQRVAVLMKGDVEVPSDILGLVYTPFDDAGAWGLTFAKELKASGFSIDLNTVAGF
jgi:predicted nucleotide-binding protein